ncbi:uncharacterized protein LOC124162975 isoform X1 [Ischnura elegans]|uniref:uncharacterized protein LOC124162975 isoform X1 n=1 Tax=Ischnura elegans TaxID=197161 RepID=UPI001ED87926|nr:uncharacterized protein LOC124162975 isoform X1 [Ischnura elegans]
MSKGITEKLIEKVKGYPFIYQPQHEHYSSMRLKEETWAKIARELGYQNGDEVRDHWKKLRDCHRDALRRQRKRNSKGITDVKKWMYQKEMNFLIPFMGKRTTSGERGHHKYEDDADYQAGESQMEACEEVGDSSRDVPEEPPVPGESQVQKRIPDSVVHAPLRHFSQYEERRSEDSKLAILQPENNGDPISVSVTRENHAEPRSVVVVRENHEDNRSVGVPRDGQEDELYHFFMSMYFSTARLPNRLRCKVKRTIFAAVTQAEEENLSGGDPLGDIG